MFSVQFTGHGVNIHVVVEEENGNKRGTWSVAPGDEFGQDKRILDRDPGFSGQTTL